MFFSIISIFYLLLPTKHLHIHHIIIDMVSIFTKAFLARNGCSANKVAVSYTHLAPPHHNNPRLPSSSVSATKTSRGCDLAQRHPSTVHEVYRSDVPNAVSYTHLHRYIILQDARHRTGLMDAGAILYIHSVSTSDGIHVRAQYRTIPDLSLIHICLCARSQPLEVFVALTELDGKRGLL